MRSVESLSKLLRRRREKREPSYNSTEDKPRPRRLSVQRQLDKVPTGSAMRQSSWNDADHSFNDRVTRAAREVLKNLRGVVLLVGNEEIGYSVKKPAEGSWSSREQRVAARSSDRKA